MKSVSAAVVLFSALIFVGTSSPALSQNETYIPIDGEKDIFAEWAEFSPEGIPESSPLLASARELGPFLCLAMQHETDFDLTRDELADIGILAAKDQKSYFSGKSLQRLAPELGWVEVSIRRSGLEIYPLPEFKKSEKYSDFAVKLEGDAPGLMSESGVRIAMFTIEVLTYGGDQLPIEFPILQTKAGEIYTFPRWFMEGGHTKGGIRVSRDAVPADVRERLERRVEEQQRRIDARVQPVEERQASGTSFVPYLIWGGVGCIVAGIAFVILRKSRMA